MGGYGTHLPCIDFIRALGMRLSLDDASLRCTTYPYVSLGRKQVRPMKSGILEIIGAVQFIVISWIVF